MNKTKFISVVIIIILITASLFGCNKVENKNNDSVLQTEQRTTAETEKDTMSETESETEPTTEEVTESLSAQFENILAYGYDGNDEYEMVAEETEDYDGVKLKIGIIKNNKWLLKPTSKMPFVDDDGTIYGGGTSLEYTNLEDYLYCDNIVKYIGNGCFLCEGTKYTNSTLEEDYVVAVIYNANTKKYYEKTFDIDHKHICVSNGCFPGYYPDYNNIHQISKKDSLVIVDRFAYSDYTEIEILDTNTMKSYTISTDFRAVYVNPISENIIAVSNEPGNEIHFINTDGNKVFNKSFKINTLKSQTIAFEDGKCTFDIVNNKGTEYTITINKKGKVLDSYEI